MRFLLSTGSLYAYGVNRCFALAAAAGFDGMEVVVDRRWDTRQPEYLQALGDQYRLPILALHTPFDDDILREWPDNPPGRIRETVRLAEAVGAEVVIHHLPLRPEVRWLRVRTTRVPWPILFPRSGSTYAAWLLDGYAQLQAATPVTLCIENMPALRRFGRRWNPARWNTIEGLLRFPHLTLDTTHLGTWGLDPTEVYTQLGGRVRHVHLSNFDGQEHRRPETGRLHLDRLLGRLAADGFAGTVTLELAPDALGAGQSDAAVLALLRGSLDYCRQAVVK